MRQMISAAQSSSFPLIYYSFKFNPNQARRIRTQLPSFRFFVSSKKWDFQDFQGYAKPARLLPASEVQFSSAPSVEQMIDSSSTHGLQSLYRIKLGTSVMYGSGLTDLNSGVLVCVIDENDDSILLRLPACTASSDSMLSERNVMPEVLHFQRSSVDEFVFKGPALGSVAAIWISLESGQWRIGSMSLLVLCQRQSPSAETDKKDMQCAALQYKFNIEDVLLGEASDFPMIECRPCSVTGLSEKDLACLDTEVFKSSSLDSHSLSGKDTMKEYANLKFSLLFYDTILVLAGSLFASFSTGEDAAIAFLTGGAGGFMYLLLLQRSVDTLPAQDLFLGTADVSGLRKFKGSATTLVLAFGFAIVAATYISGDKGRMLEPKEVIFGMIGFLMCKVSVVMAAFKPLPTGLIRLDK